MKKIYMKICEFDFVLNEYLFLFLSIYSHLNVFKKILLQ